MIPFKNLKSGFSFIEIMVALTLLGIFGSSLFLVQNNIFAKVSKIHHKLFFNQDVPYGLFELKNKLHAAILEKQSIDAITIQEDKKNPDRKIDIKLLKISDNSELKDFSKHIRIVKSSTIYDTRAFNSFNLIYIPELKENKKAEEKSKKPEMMKS